MSKEKVNVTPWEVSGEVNYTKLVKEFGTSLITEKIYSDLGNNIPPLIKRHIYFSHRDLDIWIDAWKKKKKISIVTGRGPSEKMHLGHLVPFLAAKTLQDKFGCKVYIPISDDEKFFVKENLTYKDVIRYANENILDIIALGFDPEKTFIVQDFKYTPMYIFAARVAKRISYSTAKAIFGLEPSQNIGWTFYPAMQAAHILLPQFLEGPHNTLVPVGIDQDPFIRLTRDIAVHKDFRFVKPSAIHAKFIPSLHGSAKMSSSENGVIFLTDNPKEVESKIKKYAFSGGRDTLEEHRKLGGNPDIDVSFQYLNIFFEPDDKELDLIYQEYKSGKMLTSELKNIVIKKINLFLIEHQRKREEAKKMIDKFIYKVDKV
ncbi:MAG: tryptophan--tRNA ligase [Nanoarchaeota archaeon]